MNNCQVHSGSLLKHMRRDSGAPLRSQASKTEKKTVTGKVLKIILKVKVMNRRKKTTTLFYVYT